MRLAAHRTVDATPERVYAFLADLRNHRHLADRYLRLEALRRDRRGARISIRAPGGLRRTTRTLVTTEVAPRRFGGTARAGARTRAVVCWTIEPRAEGAVVALEATVTDAGPVDRLLLALGGGWWLRRRFERVVERAAERVSLPQADQSGTTLRLS